jgi:hypothetical protein
VPHQQLDPCEASSASGFGQKVAVDPSPRRGAWASRVSRNGVVLGGFVRSVAGSTVIEGRLAGFSSRAYSGLGELAKCMCLPWVEEKCGSGTFPYL